MKALRNVLIGGSGRTQLVFLLLIAAVILVGATYFTYLSRGEYRDREGYQLLSMMLERESQDWKAAGLDMDHVVIDGPNAQAFACRPEIPEQFRDAAEDLAKILVARYQFIKKFKFRKSNAAKGRCEISASSSFSSTAQIKPG